MKQEEEERLYLFVWNMLEERVNQMEQEEERVNQMEPAGVKS